MCLGASVAVTVQSLMFIECMSSWSNAVETHIIARVQLNTEAFLALELLGVDNLQDDFGQWPNITIGLCQFE